MKGMRLSTVGIVGVAVLAAGAILLGFVGRRPAHLSALVPDDFSYGIFYRSANELRELYEGPYQRRDTDPARLRIGAPANVPGFDGIAYDEPAGAFWRDGQEVLLVPIVDFDAFEDAFDQNRENLNIRPPRRPASNYATLSTGRYEAERGDDHPLVRRALERFPVAVCGRPRDARTFRDMLAYLFVRESPRKPPGVPLAAREVRRIPDAVAGAAAEECDDLLIGLLQPDEDALPAVLEVTPRAGGLLERAAPLADRVDLVGMVASFPFNTVLCLGAVLDARGWKDVGLPLPVGDGAFAFGLVEHKHHARRFTLLVAARPAGEAALGALAAGGHAALLDDPATEFSFETVRAGQTEVRTARLGNEPPVWLKTVLASAARKKPPVYVSTAVADGIWYAAVGSQAQPVVQHALGCLRDAPELGLSRSKPVADDAELLRGPHTAVALVTASGLEALRYPMPLVEIASQGTPPSVTAFLDVTNGRATTRLRLAR